MLRILQRMLMALPDTVTAGVYLSAWLFPLAWSPSLVRNLMLLMLLEFFVIHSNAFLMAAMGNQQSGPWRKLAALVGIGLFYLAFVGAFALAFDAWWPVWSFLWLLIGKWIGVIVRPKHASEELGKQAGIWLSSVALFLLAVIATAILPIPALGISSDVLQTLNLPGSGLWVEKPQTVVCAGFVYFAGLAWVKWRDRSSAYVNPFAQQ